MVMIRKKIVRNYKAFCYRSIKNRGKKGEKQDTKKGKKDRYSGGFFTWYRMIDINLHNFNSFLLLTVFIKFCTVYIFGFLHSLVGSIEFLSSVKRGHLKI